MTTDLLDIYLTLESDAHFRHLRREGIRLVQGDGPCPADVMLVGEAPGARENGAGKPFVGASGAVLNQLLELADLRREDVFVTNVVKYRPPMNRTPFPAEVLASLPYLRQEFKLVSPRLVIACGAVAHSVFQSTGSLTAFPQGQLVRMGKNCWYTGIYHPAFGLRNAKARERIEEAWETLGLMLKEVGFHD